MALMSQSEFAKLVKSRKIILQNGKIDSDAALSAIEAQSEPSTALRSNPRGRK